MRSWLRALSLIGRRVRVGLSQMRKRNVNESGAGGGIFYNDS